MNALGDNPWAFLLLQCDRRLASIFVRYRFGEWEIPIGAPIGLALLVLWAGAVRVFGWGYLIQIAWPNIRGDVLAPAVNSWPVVDPESTEFLAWPLYAALVFFVAVKPAWETWRRRRRRAEVQRVFPGVSVFLSSSADPNVDPAAFDRDWYRSQVLAEPLAGLVLSVVGWVLDPVFGFYVGTNTLLLWANSLSWAHQRREDRLQLQDSMEMQEYRARMMEEVQGRYGGRNKGGIAGTARVVS